MGLRTGPADSWLSASGLVLLSLFNVMYLFYMGQVSSGLLSGLQNIGYKGESETAIALNNVIII